MQPSVTHVVCFVFEEGLGIRVSKARRMMQIIISTTIMATRTVVFFLQRMFEPTADDDVDVAENLTLCSPSPPSVKTRAVSLFPMRCWSSSIESSLRRGIFVVPSLVSARV